MKMKPVMLDEQIILEKLNFGLATYLSEEMIEDWGIETTVDRVSKMITVRIRQFILAKHLQKISYPSSWVQALKERWLPAFILGKFPVTYKTYNVYAMYPSMKFDVGEHKAKIYIQETGE